MVVRLSDVLSKPPQHQFVQVDGFLMNKRGYGAKGQFAYRNGRIELFLYELLIYEPSLSKVH